MRQARRLVSHVCLAFLVGLLMVGPDGSAWAEPSSPPPPTSLGPVSNKKAPKITVGAGVGAAPQHEGSNEYRAIPIVVARARWGAKYFVGTDGQGLRADIMPSMAVEAGPAFTVRAPRDGRVRDPVISQLPQIGRAIEGGAFLAFNLPFLPSRIKRDALTFDATALQDLSGVHDGYTIRVAMRYRGLVSRRLVVQVGPFATWASDEFMSSYFDVTSAGAAASGLDTFDATAGWKDVGVALNSRVKLTQTWNVNWIVSHRRFLGDAKDSPIVSERGDTGVWLSGAALAYTF